MDDPTLVEQAAKLAHCVTLPNPNSVAHALNCYLSCAAFVGDHVTTGTVFFTNVDGVKYWWVCVSPACDMELRQPSDAASWWRELHPTRPMLALKLTASSVDSAIENATRGRNIFVNLGGDALVFDICHEYTRLPRPELFLILDQGRSHLPEPSGYQLRWFEGHRIVSNAENMNPGLTDKIKFYAAAQLREPYASGLLQQTGFHSSRIGVDFVNFVVGGSPVNSNADG